MGETTVGIVTAILTTLVPLAFRSTKEGKKLETSEIARELHNFLQSSVENFDAEEWNLERIQDIVSALQNLIQSTDDPHDKSPWFPFSLIHRSCKIRVTNGTKKLCCHA